MKTVKQLISIKRQLPIKVIKRKVGQWYRWYLYNDRNGYGSYYTQSQLNDMYDYGHTFEIVKDETI